MDLRRRVGSYWGDLRDRRHLRRMVTRIVRIDALACDSSHEAAWLERNLLQRSMPPWNRVAGGMEVPLAIVVDVSSPAVRAVHNADPSDLTFGPYLGGNQVRTAVSGLLRAFPLHYASTRLAGAAKELATVRGYAEASPDDLAAAVIGVLRRDPVAVASLADNLTARRDAASAALAFELAARIQSEIEALAWITQEQKVYRADGGQAVAWGYADGLLLRLEIRDGRLDGWRIRQTKPATAAPLVTATPPQWQAFAQRNAELAAALSTLREGRA
jgi:excinuclease UvrABC nuclease subunit